MFLYFVVAIFSVIAGATSNTPEIFSVVPRSENDISGSFRVKSADLVILNMADEVMGINFAYCFEFIFFNIPPGFLILQNVIEKQLINELRQRFFQENGEKSGLPRILAHISAEVTCKSFPIIFKQAFSRKMTPNFESSMKKFLIR